MFVRLKLVWFVNELLVLVVLCCNLLLLLFSTVCISCMFSFYSFIT